jgi:tRNA(fMet)-specific endonuclease VapC
MPARHESSPLVLDTCVVVNFLRGNDVGQHMAKTYGLFSRANRPHISIATVAELQSFAGQNNWGAPKREALQRFLQTLIKVDIDGDEDLLSCYVHLDVASRGLSRKMGKNDLWIAATARALNAVLLTNDQDFGHLAWSDLQSEYTDPASLQLKPVAGGPA